MTLCSRHPRFTIALSILIFVSVLLFANSDLHVRLLNSMGFRRGGGLAELLNIEDMHYQKMLDQRQDFVKKWGPTADKINP